MTKFAEKVSSFVQKFTGLSQKEGRVSTNKLPVSHEISDLARLAAAEGCVLLKNDGVLPFRKNETVAVFGRCQKDYFYVGYGSGGDVVAPYRINPMTAFQESGDVSYDKELADVYEKWCAENPVYHGYWGLWPRHYPEMPLSDELIKKAADKAETALIFIGRSSGEARESTLEKGSFYLTDEEISMLKSISAHFKKKAVVLNIGAIIDLSWVEPAGIDALLIAWQGGMESGHAVSDVLSGKVNPSGRLTDTVAVSYEDYPSAGNFGNKKFNNYAEDIYVGYRWFETFATERVLYPFGFGLSYTDFDISCDESYILQDEFICSVSVTNKGDAAGKEVVQLYYGAPQGKLGKPLKSLAAFKKTKILVPGETEKLELRFSLKDMASYDDSGKTGFKSAFVMEAGVYPVYIGRDCRSAEKVYEYNVQDIRVIGRPGEASAPAKNFERTVAGYDGDRLIPVRETVPLAKAKLKDIISSNLPKEIPYTGDKGIKLADVKSGKNNLDEFIAQLNIDELEAISRGHYTMDSPLGAKGNAGALGGVTQSLRDKGVIPIIVTDGPSGLRLDAHCSLLPNGTALACTFNTELIEELYGKLAEEMAARGSDILLGPGMNIHRNPLCGRNFEYFSEDPYVTGMIAAAVVRGIQKHGAAACPKHFACNNQEFNRSKNDSRLSERALREIYLKGFEICIGESKPKTIMTSYNKINGVWGHYNYWLCTKILREEWGFDGCVMTDWWMRSSRSPEFPKLKNNAYRVRAQIDIFMPGGGRIFYKSKPDGTLLASLGKKNGITLAELQRTAKNVLNLVLRKE